MEGYPLSEYNNMSLFQTYGSDAICSTNQILESICPTPDDKIRPLLSIKEDLINHMKDDFINDSQLDEEEETYLEGTSNIITQFIERFKKQQQTMQDAEIKMKKVIETNKKDIDILITFIEFLTTINNKCSQDTETLQTDIHKVSEDIRKDSQMKQMKEDYIVEKKKFHKYLNILKLLNQMNVGSTCSICLGENVDSFFDPCGHTACTNCCERNRNYNDNNCPLCRKDIIKIHKLYFT